MRNDLQRKVGQAFCPAAFIHDTPEGIAQIERYISDYEIGGLTFFYSRQSVETNFDRRTYVREKDSVTQLARMIDHYQQLSKEPLLISIDAEWGLGMRIDSHPPFPYPLTLGAAHSTDLVFEVGRAIAQELKSVGVHFNLAPVVDINIDPKNPVIGYRSFGEDPEKVYQLARAYYEGMKSEGILGCVKHFPGHGDTHVDSHLGLPIINKSLEQLEKCELYPFRKFVEDDIECVMVGHLRIPEFDPELPASISPKIITELLRNEWGFKGAVMTDALNMRSVFGGDEPGFVELSAFQAGNDMLCFTPNLEEAFEKIVSSAHVSRITAAADRVAELKKKARLTEQPFRSYPPDSSDLRARLAKKTVTVLKPLTQPFSNELALVELFNSSDLADRNDHLIKSASALQEVILQMVDHTEVWFWIAPPSQKPGDHYGMGAEMITKINELIHEKTVHLAWLGNPYGLQLVNWQACESVVLGYQDLPEFRNQVRWYWQELQAPLGTLPVEL